MKKVIAIVVIVVTLVCATPTFLHSADSIGSVVGTYAVLGTNPDMSTYALEVRIQVTADNKAWMEYMFQGQLVAVGVGIRTNNVLSVVFQVSNGTIGLSSFKIEKNKLIGEWALPGVDGRGTELFSRIKALTPAPVVPVEPPVLPPAKTTPINPHETFKL